MMEKLSHALQSTLFLCFLTTQGARDCSSKVDNDCRFLLLYYFLAFSFSFSLSLQSQSNKTIRSQTTYGVKYREYMWRKIQRVHTLILPMEISLIVLESWRIISGEKNSNKKKLQSSVHQHGAPLSACTARGRQK